MPETPSPTADPAPLSGPAFLLRALRHRNYRLFFSGQSISLIGTWMTKIATSWLIYRLTGSALLLGLVGFAGQIPSFLLAPIAGVLVDRWDRHRLLVVTQVLAMLQSAALAALALAGVINVWHVLALSLFQGVINAFDMPVRQAFVVEMVEARADLPNAIALNSSMVNAARLIGPSVGGILIAAVGEGWCFLLDALSYIAVIASLLLMRLPRREQSPKKGAPILPELRAGWSYVVASAPIASILALLTLVSIVGMPYTVLMPIVASTVLRGGSHTLGFLMGAVGVGALSGAVYLASRRSVLGLGRIVPIATALFGFGLLGFGLSRHLWLSLPLLVITGLGFMVQMAASNTLVQTLVDDDKRGRVMSFYAMAFVGTAPFGSLLAGALAHRIGAPATIVLSGIGCLLGALWFASRLPVLRERVRPIYIERGILPSLPSTELAPPISPISAGIQSATELSVTPER
jgi:MFS family permease